MPEEESDPFSGKWRFNAAQSELSTPLPRIWTQQIVATRDEIVVNENIVRSNGVQSLVRVWARFDGTDYPISGFPLADFMAYKRLTSHSFSGIGRKNGVVVLTETATVAPDGNRLTLIYSFQTGVSQVARGMAAFEKEA